MISKPGAHKKTDDARMFYCLDCECDWLSCQCSRSELTMEKPNARNTTTKTPSESNEQWCEDHTYPDPDFQI